MNKDILGIHRLLQSIIYFQEQTANEHEDLNEKFLKIAKQCSSYIVNGLDYFNKSLPLDKSSLKNEISQLVTRISLTLKIDLGVCYNLLIQYLATKPDFEQLHTKYTSPLVFNKLLVDFTKFYWNERLSLLQLLKLTSLTWVNQWSAISEMLFAASGQKSYQELFDYAIISFEKNCESLESCIILNSTKIEKSNEQFLDDILIHNTKEQLLYELILLLEQILSLVNCELDPEKSATNFKTLFELFLKNKFALKFTDTNIPKLVQRISVLEIVILIRLAKLDYLQLFEENPEESKLDKHFLSNQVLLHSILEKIEQNTWEVNLHGPIRLFGAVCGLNKSLVSVPSVTSASASLRWEARRNLHSMQNKLSIDQLTEKLAFSAILNCNTFYLIWSLLDNPQNDLTQNPAYSRVQFLNPNFQSSMCLTSLMINISFFDLLSLMTRNIALDSLRNTISKDETKSLHGYSFITYRDFLLKNLIKCLKVMIHVSPHISTFEQDNQKAGVIARIKCIFDELSEGFPADLTLIDLLIALVEGSDATIQNDSSDSESHQEDSNQLVRQFLNGLPYFCEPQTDELLDSISLLSNFNNDESMYKKGQINKNHVDSVMVQLNEMRYPYSTENNSNLEDRRSTLLQPPENRFTLPRGTEGNLKGKELVIWHYNYAIWPVLHSIIPRFEKHLLNLCANSSVISNEYFNIHLNDLQTLVNLLRVFCQAEIELSNCMCFLPRLWNLLIRSMEILHSSPRGLSFKPDSILGHTLNVLEGQILADLLSLTGFLAPHGISLAYASSSQSNSSNINLRALQAWHSTCQILDADQRVLLRSSSSFETYDEPSKVNNLGPYYRIANSRILQLISPSLSKRSFAPSFADTEKTSISSVIRLISSYGDFLSGLLSAEKLLYRSSVSTAFIQGEEDDLLNSSYTNLYKIPSLDIFMGGIIFVIDSLFSFWLQTEHNICEIPTRSASSLIQSKIFSPIDLRTFGNLTAKFCGIIADLLTVHTTCFVTCKSRLEAMKSFIHQILLKSPFALANLVEISSLDPSLILPSFNPRDMKCVSLFDLDLNGDLLEYNDPNLERINLAEALTMTFTIIHLLLVRDDRPDTIETLPDDANILNVFKPILQAINLKSVTSLTGFSYSLYLLNLLCFSLSHQLKSNLILSIFKLLKRLVQIQPDSLPANLNVWLRIAQYLPTLQKISLVLNRTLLSETVDTEVCDAESLPHRLIKSILLDYLAETILCSKNSSILVKILCNDPGYVWKPIPGNQSIEVSTLLRTMLKRFDHLDESKNEAQPMFMDFLLKFPTKYQSIWSSNSMDLMLNVSFSKLLSSLWIREFHYSLQLDKIRQAEYELFWMHLNKPLMEFFAISTKTTDEKVNFILENPNIIELFTNQFTILAIEYSNFTRSDTKLNKLPNYLFKCLSALSSSMYENFIQVIAKSISLASENSKSDLDIFWLLLTTCFVRFSCLLTLVLSETLTDQIVQPSFPKIMNALFLLASKLFVQMKTSMKKETLMLANQISVLITILVNKPMKKSDNILCKMEIYPQLVSFMLNIAPKEIFDAHNYHIDITASLNQILPMVFERTDSDPSKNALNHQRLFLMLHDVIIPSLNYLFIKSYINWTQIDNQFFVQLLYLNVNIFSITEKISFSLQENGEISLNFAEFFQILSKKGILDNIISVYKEYRKDQSKVSINSAILDFLILLVKILDKDNILIPCHVQILSKAFVWPDFTPNSSIENLDALTALAEAELNFIGSLIDILSSDSLSYSLFQKFVDTNFDSILQLSQAWNKNFLLEAFRKDLNKSNQQKSTNILHIPFLDLFDSGIIKLPLIEVSSSTIHFFWRLCRLNCTLSGDIPWDRSIADRVFIHSNPWFPASKISETALNQCFQMTSHSAHVSICLLASYGLLTFPSVVSQTEQSTSGPEKIAAPTNIGLRRELSLNKRSSTGTFTTTSSLPQKPSSPQPSTNIPTPILKESNVLPGRYAELQALITNINFSLGLIASLMPQLGSIIFIPMDQLTQIRPIIGLSFVTPSLTDIIPNQITFGHLTTLLQNISSILHKLSTSGGGNQIAKTNRLNLSQSLLVTLELGVSISMSQCAIALASKYVDPSIKPIVLSHVSNDLKSLTTQLHHGRLLGSSSISNRRSLTCTPDGSVVSKHLAVGSSRIRIPSSPIAQNLMSKDPLVKHLDDSMIPHLVKAIDRFLESAKNFLPGYH